MAISVIYEVKGEISKKTATSEIFIPESFSLAEYGIFAAGLATFIDAMLKGKIVAATLSIGLDLSALTSNTASSGSDVQERGCFEYLAVDGFSTKVNLPTFDTSDLVAGSEQIDLSLPAIDAFNDAMLTGVAVTGGTIQPCDVGELDIEELMFATYQTNNSGSNI